jgi:hypothetical protein
MTKVQNSSLPDFIAEFKLVTEQFTVDWDRESDKYPGYLKIDGLLCDIFIEGVIETCS